MPRRPRKHIPIIEIAATALADKLPQSVRDDLRARKVPAKQILRMFTPDHIVLHCWGGVDRWFNLDMRERGPALKVKDNLDTSRAAKAVRIDAINQERQRALLAKSRGKRKPKANRSPGGIAYRVNAWPKGRKFQNRRPA